MTGGRDLDMSFSKLEEALMTFSLRIRSGDGLAPDGVSTCTTAISEAGTLWRARGMISTREAALLVAFFANVEAVSWSYPEAIREEIFAAASQLNEKVLAALSGDIPGH